MGFGVTELIIILVIVLVLFGAKRLKNVGSDLGGAIKGFKSAVKEEENKTAEDEKKLEQKDGDNVFDVAAEEKKPEEKKDKA